MKVGILSAATGNGHISVAHALRNELAKRGIEAHSFDRFYEELMVSNKIISDYYNFLLTTSTELCCKFSELSCLTRPDQSEDFYAGVKEALYRFFREHDFDKLISTSHTINHAVLRAMEELGLKGQIGYYTVITDPFFPISVGFDAAGADKYYCASDSVAGFLKKRKIDEDRIVQTPFPVHEKFLRAYPEEERREIRRSLGLRGSGRVLLINSGSQGAYHYIRFLKTAMAVFPELEILFVSGKNASLQTMAELAAEDCEDRVKVFGFADRIEQLVAASDAVLTKPGANAFFECLYMGKPVLVDAVNGFLYQEKGVAGFMKTHPAGAVLHSFEELPDRLAELLTAGEGGAGGGVPAAGTYDGAKQIVDDMLAG